MSDSTRHCTLSTWLGDHQDKHALLDALAERPAQWLSGKSECSEIIISSRIRLARNLNNFLFARKLRPADASKLLKTVSSSVERVSRLDGFVSLNLNTLTSIEKAILVERRLISPNFAQKKKPRSLIIGPQEQISLMINEEDHLRIQAMQPALGLREAWKNISAFDAELSEHLDYAFSDELGYLTACPTNVGTGLRASIFIHLPALKDSEKINAVLQELGPNEITIRGFYGEGSRMLGDIYQISNQLTLGRVEGRIIDRMVLVAGRLVELEKAERKRLDLIKVEDRVLRAIAILQAEKLLETNELLRLLSEVRLGSDLGIIEPISCALLNELIVLSQSAHLQKIMKREMDTRRRDQARAVFVRQKLSLSKHPYLEE